jgi:hypothetical protein
MCFASLGEIISSLDTSALKVQAFLEISIILTTAAITDKHSK